MTTPILLTIAIPTYNRPNKIIERVGELIPQLTPEVEFVIIDNHSPFSVKELIEQHRPESIGKINHIRNITNIGCNANICRCFEVGRGKWLWLLGDDDQVTNDAVNQIINEIKSYPADSRNAGFTCSTIIYSYPEDITLTTFSQFCKILADPFKFSNALFISGQVYHTETARNHLHHGYDYITSCGPQLVITMKSIAGGGIWKLLKIHSVNYPPEELVTDWNRTTVSMGLPLLIDSMNDTNILLSSLKKGLSIHLSYFSIRSGVKNLVFTDYKTAKFWELYYLRLLPVAGGKKRITVILLLLLGKNIKCRTSNEKHFENLHLHVFSQKFATYSSPLNIIIFYFSLCILCRK